MSDRIEVRAGQPPWEPNLDAHVRELLDFWDVPQAAVIEAHGHVYLGANALGPSGDAACWLYVRISEEDIDPLVQAPDVRAAIAATLLTDYVTAAACWRGTIFHSEFVPPQESFPALISAALEAIEEGLDRLVERSQAYTEQSRTACV